MKKIFSILVVAFSIFSATAIAQSNLTLVMKNKADNTYFSKTEFSYSVSGFNNQKEATAFYAKMKENADVASVKDLGKDANGNYSAVVTMKGVQNKAYYLNWASNLGISYIMDVRGEKHTPQELLAAKESNHNHASEGAHKH